MRGGWGGILQRPTVYRGKNARGGGVIPHDLLYAVASYRENAGDEVLHLGIPP